MAKKTCPNCESKLGGLRGNAPFQCESCSKVFCTRCTKGLGPIRKCLNCGGQARLKRTIQ